MPPGMILANGGAAAGLYAQGTGGMPAMGAGWDGGLPAGGDVPGMDPGAASADMELGHGRSMIDMMDDLDLDAL